jgi:hypothetical protein
MTHRDAEQYERAKRAIQSYLQDGEWHASREIHERLANEVPNDWIFGAEGAWNRAPSNGRPVLLRLS